ncbi:glycosyltransferase family 2 protein [Microbacterium rhizomatis]|uniref:glycosyltransferase family 2 protein n=1 Tax=Microbacterium rhizomatis TaxID=1631477 RepID=UPI001FE6FED6|nr:glycosyltransferase family 2 protein [Microbacterium rhizomatis]
MRSRHDRSIDTRAVSPEESPSRATVSVVIPCYNYARYLPEAVASALDQIGADVEVIVVDDASTDDSAAVAADLARSDGRVRVVANAENSGPVATFNRGLAAATGEFVVRLDADDVLTPGALQRAAAVMQRLPDVGLVYGRPLHFSGDALPPARSRPSQWLVWKGADWLAARCADGTNVITSPEVTMRRSVVDVVGGQRELAHTHDMEMWLRIAAHADVAYIQGADQAWHREHAASLSTQAEAPLVILADIRVAFDTLFAGLGPGYPAIDRLRARAHRAVSRQALAEAGSRIDRGRSADDLLDFAAAVDPTITGTKAWRRAKARSQHPAPRSVALARGLPDRVRRRLSAASRMRRWREAGVYEKIRVEGAPA